MRIQFLISWFVLGQFFAYGQTNTKTDTIKDGPYVFYKNDTLKAVWIYNSVPSDYLLWPHNYAQEKEAVGLTCEYDQLINPFKEKPDYQQLYKEVDSIAVISDVHGNYDQYITLLKANGIIDSALNWNFGHGHLVFLGDALDRGDKVTELLWHLFNLENQATKAGGKVHVMLGNHEAMVFDGDLRYIHEKYKRVEILTKTRYDAFFSEHSLFGKWLRNQPVIITINDILFVHAGISMDMVRAKISIKEANKICNTQIFGNSPITASDLEKVNLLEGNKGPLWYRGYFETKNFNQSTLDSILSYYETKHIVVGHTTFKRIQNPYSYKLLGVDAGIGYGYDGEMLILKNNKYYKGSILGIRREL